MNTYERSFRFGLLLLSLGAFWQPSQAASPAATTTKLASSSNPSNYGQSVTLTATVSASKATGSVTFNDGSSVLGTSNLTSGTATLVVSTLSLGTHPLTAAYSGDNNYAASTSAALTETVGPPITTITFKSSPNPSSFGQTVNLTATLSPSTATGNVTFNDGSTALGTSSVYNGSGAMSVTTLSVGSHALNAVYSGDAHDPGSTSATLTQTVTQAKTETTLTSSFNPSGTGQNVTLTATVTPSSATGTVTFKDGSTTVGSSSLTGGTAILGLTTLAAGAHSMTAVYGGDTNDTTSTSAVLKQTVNQATATTLTTSANPVSIGQGVTLTAAVSPATATGSVTFMDGTASLGTSALSGGAATLALTTLSVGAHSLTAVYGGDKNNAGSVSAVLTQTVSQAPTTTTLASSANPSTSGQSITLTATVSPLTATGSVTFKDGAAILGSGALTGGTATLALTTLSSGAHALTAVYGGDTNDTGSTSAALTQTVNQVVTTTTLSSSANPSTYAQSMTLTATVSPSTATGSITFKDASTTVGSATLTSGTATLTLTTLSSGTHSLTAVYAGDANNATSTSAALTQTVNPATTTTSLNASPNPSSYGQSVTLTAAVSPASGSGSITFKDGSSTLGSSTLRNGTATLPVTTLSTGTHSLTAVYSGDTNNAASTSTTLTQTVNQATTTTTLGSSANPSASGQSVTLTATVSPSAATGSVTFQDGATTLGSSNLNAGIATLTTATLLSGTHPLTAVYSGDANNTGSTSATWTQTVRQATTTTALISSGNPSPYGQTVTLTATVAPPAATGSVTFQDGGASLGSSPLNGGIATLTLTTLSSGPHVMTAVYSGDPNYSTSTSPALTQTVNPTPTTTTLTSSANPTTAGQTVTLTATVSSGLGSLTFKDGTATLSSTLLNNGTATLTLTTLSIGSHPLTAVYGGDANDAASTSPALTQTVNQATTTTTLTTSPNPSLAGQSVTLTATVSNGSGSVTVMDGTATLGSSPLTNGIAVLTLTTLSVGTHALTAVYSGDTNDAASTSAIVTQTVNQASTTTTLNSAPNPSLTGETVTLTATVSPSGSGSVTFKDGSTTLGTGNLNAGVATLTVTTLAIGTHALTAVYSGDTNDAASTSAIVTQTVNQVATTTTLNSSPNPSLPGQGVTLTASVSPAGSGSVTFMDGSATLGTGTLTAGIATLTVTTLATGPHVLTADYSGDSNNAASTSAILTQTVNPVTTTTTLNSSPNPSASGQSLTLTATVSPAAASGSVAFMDSASTLGSSSLLGGTATLNLTTLTTGSHALTAVYSGDTNDAASTSATLTQTVNGTTPVAPCAPNFTYTMGQPAPTPIVCQFTANLSAAFTASTTASWLQVNPSSGLLGPSPALLSLSVDPTGLSAGPYSGSFTLTGPQIGSLTIPAQLAVVPAGTLLATPTSISLNYQQGSSAPLPQTLTISSTNGTQLPFTVSTDSSAWLTPGMSAGTTPAPFAVTINPTALVPNTYTGTLTISSPGLPPMAVLVNLGVIAPLPPQLSAPASPVNLMGLQGGQPATAQVQVANMGGGVLSFTATPSSASWLSVSPPSGIAPQSLIITADPSSVAPGTYQACVTVTGADGTTITIPVTFSVAAAAPVILVSQTGLSFRAVSQGGVPLPQQLTILNVGTGTLNWAATASTLTGDPWLLISSSGGTVQQPFVDTSSVVSVSIDPNVVATLAPGDYYGQIQIADLADPAVNSPQLVTVILSVLPSGSDPGPEVRPSSLIFTGQAGVSPSPQNVSIGIRRSAGDQYLSSYTGSGFTYSPAGAPIQPNQPATLQVIPDFSAIAPGTAAQGAITLQFSDGAVRTINLLSVAAPSAAASCANLNLQWLAPSQASFTVVQGGAQTLELQIVDNCGNLVGPANPQAASVQATFSNQDTPVNLVHIGNGTWTGTWQPVNPPSGPVTVTVTALNSTGPSMQTGQASPIYGTVLPGTVPIITASSVQQAATMVLGAPVAPGTLIMLPALNLASGPSQVFLGMEALALTMQVPFDVPVNTQFQLTLQQNNQLSLPVPLVIAAAQPGIFTVDGSGTGQGVIYMSDGVTLAQPGTPAVAGETILIYCTGLGTATPLSVTIGGQDGQATVGTSVPGQPGVYQVSATVPSGVSGDAIPVVITVAGAASPPVTMSVQ